MGGKYLDYQPVPDDELLAWAAEGEAGADAKLAGQIRRLLESPASRGFFGPFRAIANSRTSLCVIIRTIWCGGF